MNPSPLDAYLRQQIPLSTAMGLRVLEAQPGRVRIALPLAPNHNPHGTVFGGALSAVGLLTGWVLLHGAFEAAGLQAKLVGQRGDCEFLAPADGDCIAECLCPAAELAAVLSSFRDRGRARLSLDTLIRAGEREVARHRGTYVALPESR